MLKGGRVDSPPGGLSAGSAAAMVFSFVWRIEKLEELIEFFLPSQVNRFNKNCLFIFFLQIRADFFGW
jgi:hypothetical protein